MSNTRTSLGEQAAFDALIEHTLTTFEDNQIIKLRKYAFSHQEQLTTVILPSLTESTVEYAFDACTNLTTVNLGSTYQLAVNCFNNCSHLNAILLYRNYYTTSIYYEPWQVFKSTPINNDNGIIYVPNSQLSSYKSDSNWKPISYLIFSLNEYPQSDPSSIKDSWDTIITNCNTKTIDNYNIGDTKQLIFGDNIVLMEIVAKNTDTLANSNDTAALTWMCKNCYLTHRIDISNGHRGGWKQCELRTWLQGSEIFQSFPIALQNGIKEVNKLTYYYSNSTIDSSTETIWIPSAYEMGLNGYETSDNNIQYTYFNTNAKRQKRKNGTTISYPLRSESSASYIDYAAISNGGVSANIYGNEAANIVFGFCT